MDHHRVEITYYDSLIMAQNPIRAVSYPYRFVRSNEQEVQTHEQDAGILLVSES